jgi:hypothetical protein
VTYPRASLPTSVSDLRPTSGARFLLVLESTTDRAAIYRCTIAVPDTEFATTATLGDDGVVEVAPCAAPAELVAALAMFAKLTARGAANRRTVGLTVWPARIQRWRAPK